MVCLVWLEEDTVERYVFSMDGACEVCVCCCQIPGPIFLGPHFFLYAVDR